MRSPKHLLLLISGIFIIGLIVSRVQCTSWLTFSGAQNGYCPNGVRALIYFLPTLILLSLAVLVKLYESPRGRRLLVLSLAVALPITFIFSFLGHHETAVYGDRSSYVQYLQGAPFVTSIGTKGAAADGYPNDYYMEAYAANYIFFALIIYVALVARTSLKKQQPLSPPQPQPVSTGESFTTQSMYGAIKTPLSAIPYEPEPPKKQTTVLVAAIFITFFIIWIVTGQWQRIFIGLT